MVFMTYANVVFSYGTERFIKKAAEVGMDGLIFRMFRLRKKKSLMLCARSTGLI
jgi:tryptophan synthase alpha chain